MKRLKEMGCWNGCIMWNQKTYCRVTHPREGPKAYVFHQCAGERGTSSTPRFSGGLLCRPGVMVREMVTELRL